MRILRVLSRLGLLLFCLLVLPLPATAASIPLVITFDRQLDQRLEGRVYTHTTTPITPLVVRVIFTIADDARGSISISGDSANWSGVSVEGALFPPAPPTPAGVGLLDRDQMSGAASERRLATTGLQYASAGWGRYTHYGADYPHWTSESGFGIGVQRSLASDLGPPSLQTLLDALRWGGTAHSTTGWYYGDYPSVDEEAMVAVSYLGTYAVDTAAATTIPEPASLLLLASGLALLRLRRTRG